MLEFIGGWLVLSIAIWLTAALLPGVKVDGFGPAVGVAAVYSVLNYLLGGIAFFLFGVFTLGLGFLFFFITIWIINAIMLSITDGLMDSFEVDSFGWALMASLVISVFSAIGSWMVF